MQHLTFARLVRPLALGILLAVAVLFGTNNNVGLGDVSAAAACPNGQTACDTTPPTVIAGHPANRAGAGRRGSPGGAAWHGGSRQHRGRLNHA